MARHDSPSKGLSRVESTNKTRPFEINRKLIFLLITALSLTPSLGNAQENSESPQKEKSKKEKVLKKTPEQPKPGVEIQKDSPGDEPIDPFKRLYEDAKKRKKKKKIKKKKKNERVA
jgi:hypothetical protein